jgi:hypothetical protein
MGFACADDFWNGYNGIWNGSTGGMGFISRIWRYRLETTTLTIRNGIRICVRGFIAEI